MDVRWSYFDITAEFLDAKSAWLLEPRKLHGQTFRFFELAGKLVRLSLEDYTLASLGFFQAIIGLERALRRHFPSDNSDSFKSLFTKAVDLEIVTDAVFSNIRPIPDDLQRQAFIEVFPTDKIPDFYSLPERKFRKLSSELPTHSRFLSVLVPRLRNQFVHGTYLLSPEYLHLTFQMREIADILS
jgi:hypothetical protein